MPDMRTNKTQAAYEAKRNSTDNAVREILENEASRRAEKSARLKALRLARELGTNHGGAEYGRAQ